MTIKTLFPRSAFVGFDNVFDELDRIARQADQKFPPHNIVKLTDDNQEYLIELAVAGYEEDELEVEVDDRTLTVRGEHKLKGREYLHKGISTKKFTRNFRLSEYVQVVGADLKAGILSIHLKVVLPETKRPRKIAISQNEEKSNDNTYTKQLLTESNKLL
jgi:molecular chaperone IbpA